MDWRLTKIISAKSSWDKFFSLYDSAGFVFRFCNSRFLISSFYQLYKNGYQSSLTCWFHRLFSVFLLTWIWIVNSCLFIKRGYQNSFSYSLNLKNSHLSLNCKFMRVDILFINTWNSLLVRGWMIVRTWLLLIESRDILMPKEMLTPRPKGRYRSTNSSLFSPLTLAGNLQR